MGIQGQLSGDLNDVLKEVGGADGASKKINLMNDDIEEKDSAIQMLVVFIDELGPAFAGQYFD